MIFSEDRIYHIAHLMADAAWKDDLIDYKDEEKALKEVRRVLIEYFRKDEIVDELVRKKIMNLKKSVYEGSREWDILYKKYYEEEIKKQI